MIEVGLASYRLEQPPYVCGAYFEQSEVVATAIDAQHIHELREQCIAKLQGWA